MLTFAWAFDRSIWGERLNTNQYLGTLSILFIALLGAYGGGGKALEYVGLNTNINLLMVASSIVFVWAYNVAESIMASTNFLVALSRILLFSLATVISLLLGVVASFVVVAAVALFLCAIIAKCLFFKAGTEKSDKPSEETTEDKES